MLDYICSMCNVYTHARTRTHARTHTHTHTHTHTANPIDQRNMGMSMKVEKSTVDQVRQRFQFNKKKKEEEKKQYGETYKLYNVS